MARENGSANTTEGKSAVVSVRVPRVLRDRIEALAGEEGISVADWCRAELLNAVRRAERRTRAS